MTAGEWCCSHENEYTGGAQKECPGTSQLKKCPMGAPPVKSKKRLSNVL